MTARLPGSHFSYQWRSFPLSEEPELNTGTSVALFRISWLCFQDTSLPFFCLVFNVILKFSSASWRHYGKLPQLLCLRALWWSLQGSHALYSSALLCSLVQITLRCCFRYVPSTHIQSELKPLRLHHHPSQTIHSLFWVFLSLDRDLLFSADGGQPATMRQSSDCWSIHPRQSLRPQRQMKSCPSSIGSFVSLCSSFVLQGHQIQSAECSSFRGAEKIAFILLCLWP